MHISLFEQLVINCTYINLHKPGCKGNFFLQDLGTGKEGKLFFAGSLTFPSSGSFIQLSIYTDFQSSRSMDT